MRLKREELFWGRAKDNAEKRLGKDTQRKNAVISNFSHQNMYKHTHINNLLAVCRMLLHVRGHRRSRTCVQMLPLTDFNSNLHKDLQLNTNIRIAL